MKKDLAIFSLIVLCIFYASAKEQKGIKARVIRNSEGIYLRVEGRDLAVCNQDKLKTYYNGQEIVITYSFAGAPERIKVLNIRR